MLSPVDNFIIKFAYTVLPGNGIVEWWSDVLPVSKIPKNSQEFLEIPRDS